MSALLISSTLLFAQSSAGAGEIAGCSADVDRSDARTFVTYSSARLAGWRLSDGTEATFTMSYDESSAPSPVTTTFDFGDRVVDINGIMANIFIVGDINAVLTRQRSPNSDVDLNMVRITEGFDPVELPDTALLEMLDIADDGRLIVRRVTDRSLYLMALDGSREPYLEHPTPDGFFDEFRTAEYVIATDLSTPTTLFIQGGEQRDLTAGIAFRRSAIFGGSEFVTINDQEIRAHTLDQTIRYVLDDPDERLRLVGSDDEGFFLADRGRRDDMDEPASIYHFDRATETLTLLGIAPTGSLVGIRSGEDIDLLYTVRRDDNGERTRRSATLVPIELEPRFATEGERSDRIARLYRAFFDRGPDEAGLNFWRPLADDPVAIADIFAGSIEFETTYGPLDDADFVDLVYQNVLARSADADGLAFWASQLGSGMTRGELMLSFSESPEFIERTATSEPTNQTDGSIHRLYLAFFERVPEQGGLCFWAEQLRQGRAISDVSSAFAGSAEFEATYGNLDNEAYVDLVYTNVLGRPPDLPGMEYWTAQLDAGLSRGDLMLEFSQSIEFRLLTDTL